MQIFYSVLDDTPRPIGGYFTVTDELTIENMAPQVTEAGVTTTRGFGYLRINLPDTVGPNLVNVTNNSGWPMRIGGDATDGFYFILEQRLNISTYPGLQPLTTFPTVAHDRFIDNDTGVVWRVLLPDDGNGNALIITEDVQAVRRHHLDPLSTRTSGAGISAQRNWNRLGINAFSNWIDSDLRTDSQRWLDNVYDSNVSVGLRERTLPYEFQNNTGVTVAQTAPGAGIEALGNARNVEWPAGVDSHLPRNPHPGINAPYSPVITPNTPGLLESDLRNPIINTLATNTPGFWRTNAQARDEEQCNNYTWPFANCAMRRAFTRVPTNAQPSNGRAFALSTSEANTFFTGDTGPQGRQAQGYLASTGARTTVGFEWLLRSVGSGFSPSGRSVGAEGAFMAFHTHSWIGGFLRPAVWVRR